MSVNWLRGLGQGVSVGYDGDQLYGGAAVGYWDDRDEFIGDLDRQLAEIRERMIVERDRLMADGDA